MRTAQDSQWPPWWWHPRWQWSPALLPGAASAPACSNLLRLVLLWARPNPAHGQQLALGANCCTAIARPVISTGGAACSGLVPTTSRLPAHGPEINLSLGRGRSLCSACPGISKELGKERGEARRRTRAFPTTCNSLHSFPCQPFARCMPAGTRLHQPHGEGSKTFARP